MRRVAHIALLWGLGACGAKAAEPLNNPAQVDPPVGELPRPETLHLVPRPELDLSHLVPDFHEELRWPLSSMNHPSLEPRFAIAQALAQPGVSWIDLCGLGAQNRYGRDKELLSYLRGWCNAIKGDVDGACANLTPLVGSTVRGIDSAVKVDLANILVNQGPADKAEHWINKHAIHDVEILDLLAANYAEIGKNQDAFEINRRVMDSDDHATAATQCRRMVREIVLADSRLSPFIDRIHSIATKPKVPDPTCVALDHKLRCWVDPGNRCSEYFRDAGVQPPTLNLLSAYHRWFSASTSSQWWELLGSATLAIPLDGAADLAIAAFENAIRLERKCTTTAYVWLKGNALELQRTFIQSASAERLSALLDECRYGRPD